MCLAVPGKIETISGDDPLTKKGRVNFSGIIKEVSLAYVPEALIGEYVIVHAGFAISKVDEDEATMVTTSVNPAGQGYLLANIFLPQLTAVVAFKQEFLFS